MLQYFWPLSVDKPIGHLRKPTSDWRLLSIHSSDETILAPPTLVTRCYVPHFDHYGDISIEILQIKNGLK